MLDKLAIDRLDLGPKLILAFVLVASLVAVTGFVGYQGVTKVDEEAHIIGKDGMQMDAAAEMKVALKHQRAEVLAAELGHSDARAEFENASGHFQTELDAIRSTELSGEQQERAGTLAQRHQEYDQLGQEYFAALEAGNTERAEELRNEMGALRADMEETATTLEETAQADMEQQLTVADRTASTSKIEILALSVVAFIAAVGIGLFVTRRITTPVEQLSTAAVAASDGDLSVQVDDHIEADEIGRMVDAFRSMQDDLRGVFAELGDVSRNLEEGDVQSDVRTDFPGTYGEVMRGIDAGTDELQAGFADIREASEGIREGDFDVDIETDRPGEYGVVLTDFEAGTDQLSESFDEIGRASTDLRDGELDSDIRTDLPGAYGEVRRDRPRDRGRGGGVQRGRGRRRRGDRGGQRCRGRVRRGDLRGHRPTERASRRGVP